MRRLSHSQINTYSTCPKKFHYHYNERLREQVTSAALLFGTTLDKTLNPMLEDLKSGKLKPVEHYVSLVQKNWESGEINNTWHKLPESLLIAYADSDFDEEILTPEDLLSIGARSTELGVTAQYQDLAVKKKQFGIENLPTNEAQFINLANWYCLLRKGELMVKKYYAEVLPKIKSVISVQKKIELNNDDGDSIIGYIDAILDFGDGQGARIVDNKTAARAYEENSANISPQLALYSSSEGLTKTAFIVMNKSIKKNRVKVCSKCSFKAEEGARHKSCSNEISGKRCGGEWIETVNPEATIEIIFGDVHPVFTDHVLDNFEETLKAINVGSYPRNFSNCLAFGRKCAFYGICHTGEPGDLIKV